MKKRLQKRGTETEETLTTRLGNAKGEIETLITMKNIFNYRIVNDKLDVSKSVLNLLVQGLYAEELTGKNTDELIASVPLPVKPASGGVFKYVAAVTILGMVAGGAYMLMKKR